VRLEHVTFGGKLVDVDNKRWDELGAEEGAIVKANWRCCATLSDIDIHDAVTKWCKDGLSRQQMQRDYGDIENWDVSRVSIMSNLFSCQRDFNDDISGWDTSAVTNMDLMFYEASSFNQSLAAWNTSQVTRMYCMFCRATSFNQPLEAWDVSNVKSMASMFYGASSFNQPLETWDTSRVLDVDVDVGHWSKRGILESLR